MGYPQTYYTSCQKGLGSSGFQFNAVTPGIAPDVMDHIQRLGGYSPPLSAPTTWTPEQLAEFPVALIFARLSDGRMAVGQSKYIGADYSGRRNGNYFTHFLIVDDVVAQSGSFYPIELWRSSMWKTAESPTLELPLLPEVEFGGNIDLDGIVAFLNEGGRLVYFEQMLSAALAALDGGRRLVIADENEAVAQWIAAMSFALPPELAWKLTFTTYSKEPARVDALVVGTTVDSDFGFTPLEIDHTFAVFDFIKHRFSLIEPTPFASFVTQAFREGAGAKIGGFGTFVTDSKMEATPRNLAAAFLAYAILKDFRVSGSDQISDVEVCGWCTDNGIVLTEKLTLRLLDRLEAQGLTIPETLDTFHRLYLAVAKSRFVAAVQGRFVELFTDQLSTSRHEALVAIGEDMAADHTPQLGQAQRFADRMMRVTDAVRLCQCLRIGELFGWLDCSEQIRERLTERVTALVAPSLSAPGAVTTTVNVILQTCDGTAGTVFLEGIIPLLGRRADDDTFFASLAPLISHPVASEKLSRFAREKRLHRLVGRIYAQKILATSGRPAVDQFQEIQREMQAVNSDLQPEDYQFVFHLVWERQPLSAQDSLWLIQKLPKISPTVLSGTTILSTVSEALIQRLDPMKELETLKSSEMTLLETLYDRAQDTQAGGLKAHRELLTALMLRSRMADLRVPADIINAVQTSWKVAEKLPPHSRSRLLKVAATHLAALEEVGRHAKLLQTGVELFGDDVSKPYALYIQQSFQKRPEIPAFLRICQVWLSLLNQKKPLELSSIGDALMTAFHGFDKPSREAIYNGIGTDPSFKAIWDDEVQSRASVVGKIKSWVTANLLRR